jgi:hypothetical protein
MNDLARYQNIFDGIAPWSGMLPDGFTVDFVGTYIDLKFRTIFPVPPELTGGKVVTTRLPVLSDGEGWFEAVNWVEAARAARDRFVMITLGACYGAQAVGSYRTLQLVNPMPSKFVAVEGDPENVAWVRQHMRDNGMDPDAQWIVQAAISNNNSPVLFPVGWPGLGIQNCYGTNEDNSRKIYADEIIASGRAKEAIRNIFINNSTGIIKNLVPGQNFPGEIKIVSAVTLADLLGPFDVVDYLESDIQQSEIVVFPPFMGALKRKVRRIHIGTHGADVHAALLGQFEKEGWDIVFNFAPNSKFDTPLGSFSTNDGVLTVRNPNL